MSLAGEALEKLDEKKVDSVVKDKTFDDFEDHLEKAKKLSGVIQDLISRYNPPEDKKRFLSILKKFELTNWSKKV